MDTEQGNKPALRIHYKFTLSDGTVKEFEIELDKATLSLLPKPRASYPEWTRLTHHQCPNCPLKEAEHPRCPVAANLTEVIDFFKDSISHHPARVEIDTETRTYLKETPLQNGISSLVGIYMVTSGCPILDKLKPMVKMHLPFATGEETLYRSLAMYLLAQYFLYRRGRQPDWDMKNLVKLYDAVRIVNKSFCERLSSTRIQDASLNAVVRLDCFADRAQFSLEEDALQEMERLFDAYLNNGEI